jgi:DNA polymerase-3 subunit epsilon
MRGFDRREEIREEARRALSMQPLYLDTETTGLGPADEVIEICVLDSNGLVLLESLVRPLGQVSKGAVRVHGITPQMLVGAPGWQQIWPQLLAILDRRCVALYNAEFDLRLMRQTHARHALRWNLQMEVVCVMELYARYFGHWDEARGDYRWQSLENAARQCGIELRPTHRAKDDALLTRALLWHIAALEA